MANVFIPKDARKLSKSYVRYHDGVIVVVKFQLPMSTRKYLKISITCTCIYYIIVLIIKRRISSNEIDLTRD